MSTETQTCDIVIPGYTLTDRIGAGGYAEVWRAEAPGGLQKAVKVVYGYYDDNVLGAVEHATPGKASTRLRHWRIAARHVVLASGAIERPFVFAGKRNRHQKSARRKCRQCGTIDWQRFFEVGTYRDCNGNATGLLGYE